MMDRVNAILRDEEFRDSISTIDANEKTRIYCKHSYDHLLAVARIMYIEALEQGMDIDKEVIYATALLHDIGRSVSNEHHDIESAKIATHILGLVGFNNDEIAEINEAILSHRTGSQSPLGGLLYRADKASRDCYYCESQDSCKWVVKNEGIER